MSRGASGAESGCWEIAVTMEVTSVASQDSKKREMKTKKSTKGWRKEMQWRLYDSIGVRVAYAFGIFDSL